MISGTTSHKTSLTALPERNGNITISQAINAYMACYQGNDKSLAQRIACWQVKLGTLTLNEVDEDHIFFAIEELFSNKHARYYVGKDADGKSIFKSKNNRMFQQQLIATQQLLVHCLHSALKDESHLNAGSTLAKQLSVDLKTMKLFAS